MSDLEGGGELELTTASGLPELGTGQPEAQVLSPGEASRQQEAGGSGAEGPQEEEEEGGGGKEARRRRRLQAKLAKLQETYRKRGIIYISRIPPHMKPQKLRQMLSAHGEICRLYLAPEDPGLRKKRKRSGRDTGKNFSEGWVEFEDKRVARGVAAALNGAQMGGRRRSAYHDDLWCLKYLPGFKWDALTEEAAYQRAVREQRVAAEVAAARRERDFYLGRVGAAKAQAAQDARQRQRPPQKQGSAPDAPAEGAAAAGTPAQQAKHPPAGTLSTGAPPAATAAARSPDMADKGAAQKGVAGAGSGSPAEQPPRKVLRTYGQRRAKPDPGSHGADVLPADLLHLLAGNRRKRPRREPAEA